MSTDETIRTILLFEKALIDKKDRRAYTVEDAPG